MLTSLIILGSIIYAAIALSVIFAGFGQEGIPFTDIKINNTALLFTVVIIFSAIWPVFLLCVPIINLFNKNKF